MDHHKFMVFSSISLSLGLRDMNDLDVYVDILDNIKQNSLDKLIKLKVIMNLLIFY